MSYSLFVDDIRNPDIEFDVIARSFDMAVKYILKNGMPNFISFDYNLGYDDKNIPLKNGYDLAKWLINLDVRGNIKFPKDFSFNVHCTNIIKKNHIEAILNNYLLFKVTLYIEE